MRADLLGEFPEWLEHLRCFEVLDDLQSQWTRRADEARANSEAALAEWIADADLRALTGETPPPQPTPPDLSHEVGNPHHIAAERRRLRDSEPGVLRSIAESAELEGARRLKDIGTEAMALLVPVLTLAEEARGILRDLRRVRGAVQTGDPNRTPVFGPAERTREIDVLGFIRAVLNDEDLAPPTRLPPPPVNRVVRDRDDVAQSGPIFGLKGHPFGSPPPWPRVRNVRRPGEI